MPGLPNRVRPVVQLADDLERIIRRRSGIDEADVARVAAAVRRLSDQLAGKAAWDPDWSDDPELRAAYLAYFVPMNLPRLRVPLAPWLASRSLAGRTLRCLDLGAGAGAALLGLCDVLRGLPPGERPAALEIVAADRSGESLRDAQAMLEEFAAIEPGLPPITFDALCLDLVTDQAVLVPLARVRGRFDLVIAANVLGELVRSAGGDLGTAEHLVLEATRELLDPRGAVALLEPGLRESARTLERLRDRWLATGELHVHAPCVHEDPCPALATRRDWCIVDLAWCPPPLVEAVDRVGGLDRRTLKFAYLLLSPEAAAAPVEDKWRVVSDVLDLKGERRVYLCGNGRWIVLRDLKREPSPSGEALGRLRRGDCVEIEGLEPAGTLFRIAPGGRLRVVDPTD
ncbi:MAG: hypothetical protein QOD06_1528 [Candidatus Binatota bacterium]|nr:hypothetical protein [Candidatus Binatota bacterium]